MPPEGVIMAISVTWLGVLATCIWYVSPGLYEGAAAPRFPQLDHAYTPVPQLVPGGGLPVDHYVYLPDVGGHVTRVCRRRSPPCSPGCGV